MINKITRDVPLFESLGLFTEAPKRKRKPRVISVRPIKKDYTNMVDPDEALDIDDIDDAGDDLSDYDDLGLDIDDDMSVDEDFSDEGSAEQETQDQIPEENEIIDVTDEDTESTGDFEVPDMDISSEDKSTEQDQNNPEVGEQSSDEIPADNNVSPEAGEQPQEGGNEVIDATGGDPEASGDLGVEVDAVPADGTDPNQQLADSSTTTGTESITKDDVRKYELFKRFVNLYGSIKYFIEKLEHGVSDNERFEYASRKALAKFKALEDLTKDYMILKFQSDSFLQNSFFYEKIKASSLLLFELLNLNKNVKEDK